MKIHSELIQLPGSECFNLQNKINISEFWPILILSFNYIYMYIRYHWKIFENLMVSRIYSRRFAGSKIAKYRFQWNFFPEPQNTKTFWGQAANPMQNFKSITIFSVNQFEKNSILAINSAILARTLFPTPEQNFRIYSVVRKRLLLMLM